jgi:cell division septum initiation protein DivIVA
LAAGQFLTREDALEAVCEVAILIEKETGLKVLGAVIHRETDHDIHVHFIVSQIGPVEIVEDPYSDDYIKILTTDQRKIIREERRKRGDDISLKAVNEELARRRKKGEMKDPTNRKAIEYQVLDRTKAPRRGMANMGQQHCSKTNLWEASGRDPAVAAVQEGHSVVSFRSVVQDAAAVAPDGDPAHKYFDYWLAKQWNQAVVERLPEEVRDQMPEVARQAAQRYVEEGSSLPNPTLDAARKKENQIIRAAARAASGIEKLATEEAERIIAEAHKKIRDTQSELEKNLKRNRQHEATLKELTVTANTEINQNKALRDKLDERKKALTQREDTLKAWEQKLSGQLIKLDAQVENLKVEREELRNERTRLRRIPIALVAEKIGFVLDEWGDLSAELPGKADVLFKHRLILKEECFEVEINRYKGSGDYVWEHELKGKGAIDLMHAFMQKRPVLEACARLAELFPESKAGIILELSESSNPDLWKELAPQNPDKAPPTNLDVNREPNSKNEPDMT